MAKIFDDSDINYEDTLSASIRRVTLDAHRLSAQKKIPMIYSNAVLTRRLDVITDSLVIELESWILAKTHEGHYTDVPSTWWQHFKQAVFPSWAQTRWPVITNRIPVKVVKICPHSTEKHKVDGFGKVHVTWMENTDD